MKVSLSILATALCVSLPAVQAGKTDCLDANRYNLEIVCRKECAKVNAVAFSVSYDENNDSCRCYGNIDGYGTYTGSGDRDSRLTCYSMEQGAKMKVLDYGDCIVDSSYHGGYGTKYEMKMCGNGEDETQAECLDKKRYNIETVCRSECSKHNSVAFAVSYAHDDTSCRCYPDMDGVYTGTGDRESHLTCYSMAEKKIKVLDYGDCIAAEINGPRVTEHIMRKCGQPHIEKLLRGKVAN